MPKNNEIYISRQKRFYKVGFEYLEYSSRNSELQGLTHSIFFLDFFLKAEFSEISGTGVKFSFEPKQMVKNGQNVASMKNQLSFAHEISKFFLEIFCKDKTKI